VPIGVHIADFVSFPLKCVIELVPAAETEAGARLRADKRAWLGERGYRVIEVMAGEVEKDVAKVLDELAAAIR
jgi:tRNA/rRNA methyltransferase